MTTCTTAACTRSTSLRGRPPAAPICAGTISGTGSDWAAQNGATLAELMARLGHSTVAAALVYQHAAAGRDAEIARRLSAMFEGQ